MKKIMTVALAVLLALALTAPLTETQASAVTQPVPAGSPPPMPDGTPPAGTPPFGVPEGGPQPGPGNGMGGPGGQGSQPDSYASVYAFTEDIALDGGAYASAGIDENAIHVVSGTLSLDGAAVTRASSGSTGGDGGSFYGVGAAVLVTGGTANITGSAIDTDSAGGTGVFAYGSGAAYVSDTVITTEKNTSGGIHVAGGGTLYAKDLTVTTNGGSSAAIRSDRGGGTMVVDGGTYVSNGSGSPAIYCTADITANNAALAANGSEALCLEGFNTVRLYDASLTGCMPDLEQNDSTWTVILYQSMSGDAQAGKGRFEMSGGSITSLNGGLFYTTNTQSEFVLSGVEVDAADDCAYFLRCTGNANRRGWGRAGENGADCSFTAISQKMDGDILWDSISRLDLYVSSGSVLTGAAVNDESCAGSGGTGHCSIRIDADSSWVVTGDSLLTNLYCEGSVVDAQGRPVSVIGTDGTVFVQGDSPYTVTVSGYSAACDMGGAGTISRWSPHAARF